jgi:hypothetical protein
LRSNHLPAVVREPEGGPGNRRQHRHVVDEAEIILCGAASVDARTRCRTQSELTLPDNHACFLDGSHLAPLLNEIGWRAFAIARLRKAQ